MKRISLSLFMVAAMSTAAFSQAWKADKAHSHVSFTITHLAISEVEGQFTDFDATITASKADFSDAKVEFTAKTASVSTDNADRDKHLSSPDFFDAAKYPTLTFVSTSTTPAGTNHYTVKGNLTLNGVTKPATLDLVYKGTITNPMSKKPTAGFSATGTVKRADFNFGTKYGAPMLGDDVTFKASGEFHQ